jgi:prepilin peptidase dependent protein B
MAGFSLIELMVAIVLGVIALTAITSFLISTVVTNTSNLSMIRLDQELRAVMLMMTQDIRRAGTWANALDDVGQNQNTNPFMNTDAGLGPITDITVVDTNADGRNECILFTYDLSDDGELDDLSDPLDPDQDERFGFRLNRANDTVQIRQNGQDCTGGGWANLTLTDGDDSPITITDLEFATTNTVVPIPGTSLGVADASVTVREIIVTLTGQARIDGNQVATRTITETVRVRNDNFTPAT